MYIKMVKNIVIQDSYGIRYEVAQTIKSVGDSTIIDVTSKIYDPRIPGHERTGYVHNNTEYVKGVINISRQVMRMNDDGYAIIAEGSTSIITDDAKDYIQMNNIPLSGQFAYKYDNTITTEIGSSVDSGSALVDIDDTLNSCVWAEIDPFGNFMPASSNVLEFTDVW